MFLSYLDSVLLIGVVLTALAVKFRLTVKLQWVAIVVSILIPIVVIGELQVYQYLRAVLSDLSITTKLLLLTVLYQRIRNNEVLLKEHEYDRFRLVVALLGLGFYPLALGISMFDPYAYGYQATALMVIATLSAVLLLVRRYFWSGTALLLAVFAYYFRILESDNLWDYLIDPVLWLYCEIFCSSKLPRWATLSITWQP